MVLFMRRWTRIAADITNCLLITAAGLVWIPGALDGAHIVLDTITTVAAPASACTMLIDPNACLDTSRFDDLR